MTTMFYLPQDVALLWCLRLTAQETNTTVSYMVRPSIQNHLDLTYIVVKVQPDVPPHLMVLDTDDDTMRESYVQYHTPEQLRKFKL